MVPYFAVRFIRIDINWWKCDGYRQWLKLPDTDKHRTAIPQRATLLQDNRTICYQVGLHLSCSSSKSPVHQPGPATKTPNHIFLQIQADIEMIQVWSLQSISCRARKIFRHLISAKIKSWCPWEVSCLISPWIISHTSLLPLHCKMRWKMQTGLPRVVSLPTQVARELSYSN